MTCNHTISAAKLDRMPRTFSIHAPARDRIDEDARQSLALLQGARQTVNVVLVALTDGVELEVWADGALRRRARFLRDSEARKYSDRLASRLERRGYRRDAESR
jgi:hypothetical protein